jgi:prephenate dehydratase
MTRVAFQGIAGAYSEEAIRQHFGPEAQGVPCRTLDALFPPVELGEVDFAMVPVENSVAGTVAGAYELMLHHDLRIHAEVVLRVRHMLLAPPGTELADLAQVRSHPQALAQCQRYLDRHGLAPEPAFDTAGSARDLAADPAPGVAAIASALAAELYGLAVVSPNIEDVAFNYTRFFVLARDDPPQPERPKTSLIFSSRHQPGALYDCLGEFAQRGINLTKIESRPRRNRPWQYIFYLDFEGYWHDPDCERAILGLLRRASFVKLLGSYPAAPAVENGGLGL